MSVSHSTFKHPCVLSVIRIKCAAVAITVDAVSEDEERHTDAEFKCTQNKHSKFITYFSAAICFSMPISYSDRYPVKKKGNLFDVKDKFIPLHTTKSQRGVEVKPHSFLTSTRQK